MGPTNAGSSATIRLKCELYLKRFIYHNTFNINNIRQIAFDFGMHSHFNLIISWNWNNKITLLHSLHLCYVLNGNSANFQPLYLN